MCWFCGSPITEIEPLGRSFRCAMCGKDLRSCRNCRFYLPGLRGDCRESHAEPAADKERGNFCEWFSLDPKFRSADSGERKALDAAASARLSFDDLFK
jgi:hypothetical protein